MGRERRESVREVVQDGQPVFLCGGMLFGGDEIREVLMVDDMV